MNAAAAVRQRVHHPRPVRPVTEQVRYGRFSVLRSVTFRVFALVITAAAAVKLSKNRVTLAAARATFAAVKRLMSRFRQGSTHGQQVYVRGEGDAGTNGGANGDLILVIRVKPHKLFVRQGYDILCDYPISFVQATLGAEVQVPTIDGKVSYNIPEGTQSGMVFRLKGKGVQRLNSTQRGDQYVTIKVEIPKGLSESQKAILRQFDENVDPSKYKQRKSFFEKMKEFLS